MNIANFIVGLLALVAAIFAANYAFKTFRASREPRLTLHYSLPFFILRNIGSTVARNISEKNDLFSWNVPELFNYSGPASPGQAGSSSVLANIAPSIAVSSLKPGEEKTACFEYENLSGQKFRSEFTIKRSENSRSVEQFSVKDVNWHKI